MNLLCGVIVIRFGIKLNLWIVWLKEVVIIIDFVMDLGVLLEFLRDKFVVGEWEVVDVEIWRLLCVLVGEEVVKRKWVYFFEVKFIFVFDLMKVDSLWK